MIYSTPELHFIGAAPNVVLCSIIGSGKFQNPCMVRPDAELDDAGHYDTIGLW